MLELGEDLFDRVQVGAVGRQEQQVGAGLPDGPSDGRVFVAAEISRHHDIAWRQCRDEELFDIGAESVAIDRAIEDAGRVDPVEAQRGDEGHGAPVDVRGAPDQALALGRPAAQGRHVGSDFFLGPGLVDEDQPARINPFLMALPTCPLGRKTRQPVRRLL